MALLLAPSGANSHRNNYDSAIDLLKSWFGKPQKIIDGHMDKIIKIPTCTEDKPYMLRSAYD